ncbi:FtsX-like permease family protein [Luteipulveratus mongoliensis]|uniref:ABC3 transporter permease C-terminal domain-containing protein n=1 Tax=Luteipulveratus mongoliensis TaxID=571913 RepID=A0A0K1JIG0_9MICO|nr:FtsX-like permease family protein [Luteipulveratus mongoliensis]AKU16491.1 hypothetical protein VV02_12480 [Luteipulveratus mongoliensis]
MSESPTLAAIRVGRRAERLTQGTNALPNRLAVLAFAVTSAALLITVAGVHAFSVRHPDPNDFNGQTYVLLAYCAAGMLVAPVLTLGGVAARLTVGRRDQRLAALRLVGATRSQVSTITVAESGRLALWGALTGVGLYAALVPLLSRIPFEGRAFEISELIVPWWWLPLDVLAVVNLAVVSGLVGLRRVAISPLGVAARQTPPRLSVVRVLGTIGAVVVWMSVGSGLGQMGAAVVMVLLAGIVAVINVIGPFVMMLLGRLVARLARGPQTLLAARRIVDDPRAAWRSVGALGLGIIVAGVGGTLADTPSADGESPFLGEDMRTGAFVTLAIIAVIAATSTGVVQAARVIDRRRELRGMALAGADPELLVATSRRETTLPLILTVVIAGSMTALIILPTIATVGAATVAWTVVAVVVSALVMVAAVRLTGPLVREAARG